jgi:transposase-like protein
MEFKNIKFSSDEICVAYLENKRWGGKPVCPYCKHDKKVYRIEAGKRFKCGNPECYKKFSVTVGTIFENSKIGLRTWFAAIYLCTAHKKGISSLQLHRDLGVTQKTAWFMLQRIREMLKDAPAMMRDTVEIDETYVGGLEKNKHASKRKKEVKSRVGRRRDIKTPVLGIVQRNGNVYAKKLIGTGHFSILPVIEKMVEKGSVIMTDNWSTYQRLGVNYEHYIIDHSKGHYAHGSIHTNTIEGFFSLLKRGIIGIYHSVSYKHLNFYCSEFCFRYNTRKLTDPQRFHVSITKVEGKRLKYKEVTYKYYGLV